MGVEAVRQIGQRLANRLRLVIVDPAQALCWTVALTAIDSRILCCLVACSVARGLG